MVKTRPCSLPDIKSGFVSSWHGRIKADVGHYIDTVALCLSFTFIWHDMVWYSYAMILYFYAMLWDIKKWYDMLSYDMVCYAMLCYAML